MGIRFSPNTTLIHFPSPDGLRLEGRFTPAGSERAVVLCHPHPLYGGSMLTPIIMHVEQAFQEAGYTTLAFNFRGVSGSQGVYGEGRSEAADVRGALAYLVETLRGAPRFQAVAGYSFGSFVGGRVAASDPAVHFYLGVAPPLGSYDFGFLHTAACRIALIGAARDEHCDGDRFAALVADLPGSPWIRVLDTNHFFAAAVPDLVAALREAIAWAAPPRP